MRARAARHARAPTPEAPERALLAILREIYADVHRHEAPATITLNSALDRDLGLDSLARLELLLRIEQAFGVQFPEAALSTAETGRDLLRLLRRAPHPPAAATWAAARAAPAATAAQAAPELATLVDVLDWHAQHHPEYVQLRILEEADGELREQAVTYAALRAGAEQIAAGLQAVGLAPRETVAIMLGTGRDYFECYLGVLIAGGVPVPIYPPVRAAQLEEHLRRQAGILSNAQTPVLITMPEAVRFARLLRAAVPALRHLVSPAELRRRAGRCVRVPLGRDDIAFIQYTSGSTGNPKGVVLTHANLLANIRIFGELVGFGSRDIVVSWLPLYHDMGLIAAWLGALHHGALLVAMSPLSFLARPERWLWAIHRYRGTLSAAPNFAFELCVRRIDDARLEGLDLSSLRLVANGSEQVRPETLERFRERFARYGLRADVVQPVYGLAEATVGLAARPPDGLPRMDRIQREPFMREHRALPAAADDPHALVFAGCGPPLPQHALRVVDDAGTPLPERREGRLEFRGPSATQGYYRNEAQTRRLLHDGWLDTGDRAYLADGELFITGRVKDIVIRGGRNLYPDEIEEAVGAVPGVRRGRVCVFGQPDPRSGTERLVVLAETREQDPSARAALHTAIVRVVADLLGEPADDVVLAAPGTVLKTSSGKVRRAATRERFEAGAVPTPRRQLLRLLLASAGPELRRLARRAAELAYGARVALALALLAPPAALLTFLMPRPAWAWAVNRAVGRLLLGAVGIRLVVQGREHLAAAPPHLLVANHASYLDALALAAALPAPYVFVAKREFLRQPLARLYFRRLGVEFVERFAIRESVRDAARLAKLAREGRRLAFFPEGTFVASPGLLPFHLGAFVTAVHAGVAVVPVALAGTRAILRGNERLPHRGSVQITIGAPLPPPPGDAFHAALALRDQARAHILAHCGEPDVAPRAAPGPGTAARARGG